MDDRARDHLRGACTGWGLAISFDPEFAKGRELLAGNIGLLIGFSP